MNRWHFLTSSFPPHRGGLGFYTSHLAHSLAERGFEVYVWAAFDKSTKKLIPDYKICASIKVNYLGVSWKKSNLLQTAKKISQLGGNTIISYRPNGYYSKIQLTRFITKIKKTSITHLIIHNLFETDYQYFPYNKIPIIISNFLNLWILYPIAKTSSKLYVTSHHRAKLINKLYCKKVITIAVPSYITKKSNKIYADNLKKAYRGEQEFLFGTFSSFKDHQILPILTQTIVKILHQNTKFIWIGFGRHAQPFVKFLSNLYPKIAPRMKQANKLTLQAISAHIQSCDLMFQPFHHGVNTQRTSAMATLFHQVPLVTSEGIKTEKIWSDSRCCVLCKWDNVDQYVETIEKLSTDISLRNNLASKGFNTYNDNFCTDKILDILINNR